MPDRLAGDVARQRTRKLAAAEERAQRGGMKEEATPAAPMLQRSALVSRLIITLSAWLAAFLIVFTLVALLREQLDSLPLAARLLVISGVLVVAMVNLVEPLLKRLAARLGGGGSPDARRSRGGDLSELGSGAELEGRMSTAEGSEIGKGNRPTPLMVEPEEGALYWVAGGFDKIRLTAGQTRGALGVTEVIETNERGGGGPPLHVHTREDETYYVIEGAYTFFIGDQTLVAPAGSVVFAPRGIPHTYRVDSPTARYLSLIVPGGWEQFFAAAGLPALTPDFSTPHEDPDFDKLGAVAERYGVDIVGPPPGQRT